MSDYTPDTNEVRFNYAAYEAEHTVRGLDGTDESEFKAEFTRWYEKEIRKARAEAWEEGAAVGADYGADAIVLNPMHHNPYRADKKEER